MVDAVLDGEPMAAARVARAAASDVRVASEEAAQSWLG